MSEPATEARTLNASLRYHISNTLSWRRLRPLQVAALEPLLRGEHALLLAPTAGGKTEAAVFPAISRMLDEGWQPLSILYVCPLRALLNNLEPRLSHYAQLVGRTVGIWHGDITASIKNQIRRQPPDMLLTTPESLEGLLVSRNTDPHAFFSGLRAVIIDEIHAFAGDDRGWHLLAILERLDRIAGRAIQRIGLSATVGNPQTLLAWMVGGSHAACQVIEAPPESTPHEAPDVQLDWVGNLTNAARVIASLHVGEKRLVFCDSRARTEELAHTLRQEGVTTFVSHSSLARDVRRHAEEQFEQTKNCVIVATSTLELGIDIGDLDRVVQIDAPGKVANLLQRLGRTGRRPGSRANCLFLATTDQAFIRAAGLLCLWSEGYVEPVEPPPQPYHVLTQQLLALCLQESGVGSAVWREWICGMPGFAALEADAVDELLHHLLESEILWQEGGRLWFGTAGERRFGRRYFRDLLSMITDSPLVSVHHGKQELGQVDRASFLVRRDQPPILLLAGHSWQVEHVDWRRKRCWVKPVKDVGRSRWLGEGQPLSFTLCQAIRRVLTGQANPPGLSRRGAIMLAEQREDHQWLAASEGATVFERLNDQQMRWWTFAGLLGNATLLGCIDKAKTAPLRYDNFSILLPSATADILRQDLSQGQYDFPQDLLPLVDERALARLKFADCLPQVLARETIASRWTDSKAARWCLGRAVEILATERLP